MNPSPIFYWAPTADADYPQIVYAMHVSAHSWDDADPLMTCQAVNTDCIILRKQSELSPVTTKEEWLAFLAAQKAGMAKWHQQQANELLKTDTP